ncbi:MAG: phosphoribosylformylglycinamidine cyclo-ligase [Candidatus Tectomicrobia bacterium]|uniref:Phosphoribosylformylglycinamidine cyclo-ligase n=1 Tax=Tectimicrobiota bacterium TaxID=2528274 RepID=A0A933LRF4_UNCTE|nr:phosphoribosylformylglycinamidine cyclo-ligase [Candidatus Tectomicrobia bacterium]
MSGNIEDKISYGHAGVDTVAEEEGLKKLVTRLKGTVRLSDNAVMLDFGYFANVLDLGNNLGLAISTDGVGTKIIVAQMMEKYDTIGIDCIAMNVNDILCVGAKPISMVDYIAVQSPDTHLLEEIAKGLYEGAKISKISIPAGEIAQIKEMIKSEKEGMGFDLVGTAVGLVPLDRIIIGQNIQDNDVLIGLRSNGIHSNGLTLARKALFEKGRRDVRTYDAKLGKTLGEELLEPTHIYVPEIMAMINRGIKLKALIHVTSDGFLNLLRVTSPCSYRITNLPEPHPIFKLIQEAGKVSDEEMFRVYNMGIGFCLVVPESEASAVLDICKKFNVEGYKIGYSVNDGKKEVIIEEKKLIGKDDKFHRL